MSTAVEITSPHSNFHQKVYVKLSLKPSDLLKVVLISCIFPLGITIFAMLEVCVCLFDEKEFDAKITLDHSHKF